MSKSPIEEAWLEIEKEAGAFCCDDHRRFFRTMFYSGAMAAMHASTGWTPDGRGFLAIRVEKIVAIGDELASHFNAAEAAEALANAGTVRH